MALSPEQVDEEVSRYMGLPEEERNTRIWEEFSSHQAITEHTGVWNPQVWDRLQEELDADTRRTELVGAGARLMTRTSVAA